MYKYRSNCIIVSVVILSFFCTVLEADASPTESLPDQNPWFDSLNVRYTGSWPFGRYSNGVACDSTRDLMFLASSGGVYILDISLPQDPVMVSDLIRTRWVVWELFYSDSDQRLYVADGYAGIEIWDIANASTPQKLGYYDTPGTADGIYVQGSYAYIANESSLRIIDVSDPAHPQEIASIDTAFYIENVHVAGNHAYVTANDGGLMVVDVSVPSNPQITGFCDSIDRARDVWASETLAYILDQDWDDSLIFHVVDVTDPYDPHEISRLDVGYLEWWELWDWCAIQISDNYAYLVSDSLHIIDISDPFSPHQVGAYGLFGTKIYVAGDYAYVSGGAIGFIVDISVPSNPQLTGSYELPFSIEDIFVLSPYAYLTDYFKGIRIFDITDPSSPSELGFCRIDNQTSAVTSDGNYAYFAYLRSIHDTVFLAVIDVSDPSNPQQVGECHTDSLAAGTYGLQIYGSYAYIAIRDYWINGVGGLWIVDISNPSAPQSVGFFYIPENDNSCFDVYVVHSIAFLTAGDLYVLDVSDPSHPVQIGYCYTPAEAHSIHVSGPYAYITDGNEGANVGLRVVNISDPSNPYEVGYCPTPNRPTRIYVSDNYAYIATVSGPRVYDITNPSNPYQIGYYNIGWIEGVSIAGSYIFTAAKDLGLQIFENLLLDVKEKHLVPIKSAEVTPTVFSGSLILPKDKSCRVFDISGRTIPPDKIKPGIYFIEIDGEIRQKVVKIR